MSIKNDKSLKVLVDLSGTIRRGQACEVTVEIKNVSNTSIVVNKRLSVGYKHSLSREIYVIICRPESEKVVGIQKVLYERVFSQPEDYIQLFPDQQIVAKFNLFDWYEVPEAGKYLLWICYQADENLAFKPKGICEGVFCSKKKIINFE